RQEVGRAHPGLDRAEWMFDGFAALPHLLGMFVEPALDGLEDLPMLPTRDPALAAGRALGLDRTGQTGCRPIAAERLALLLIRISIGQQLAGRAEIDIFLGNIDEVLLTKAAFGLGARGHGFGQRDGDARLLARKDLLAVEVAPIRHDIEAIQLQGCLRLLGY